MCKWVLDKWSSWSVQRIQFPPRLFTQSIRWVLNLTNDWSSWKNAFLNYNQKKFFFSLYRAFYGLLSSILQIHASHRLYLFHQFLVNFVKQRLLFPLSKSLVNFLIFFSVIVVPVFIRQLPFLCLLGILWCYHLKFFTGSVFFVWTSCYELSFCSQGSAFAK